VFHSRWVLGIFVFTTGSRTALGPTQSPIQWVPGALSLRVKWPGREADHLPPSSAEFKEWVELYLHSPNMPSWLGAQLKRRDNFTFTFYFTFTFRYWMRLICEYCNENWAEGGSTKPKRVCLIKMFMELIAYCIQSVNTTEMLLFCACRIYCTLISGSISTTKFMGEISANLAASGQWPARTVRWMLCPRYELCIFNDYFVDTNYSNKVVSFEVTFDISLNKKTELTHLSWYSGIRWDCSVVSNGVQRWPWVVSKDAKRGGSVVYQGTILLFPWRDRRNSWNSAFRFGDNYSTAAVGALVWTQR
jgi:hypothetical protein